MTTPTPPPTPTGIEAIVCNDIAARQQLGIAKYGTTVADNPLPLRAWLEHAYQECLDQAVYLRRAIEKIDNSQLRAEETIVTPCTPPMSRAWLDKARKALYLHAAATRVSFNPWTANLILEVLSEAGWSVTRIADIADEIADVICVAKTDAQGNCRYYNIGLPTWANFDAVRTQLRIEIGRAEKEAAK